MELTQKISQINQGNTDEFLSQMKIVKGMIQAVANGEMEIEQVLEDVNIIVDRYEKRKKVYSELF